MRNHGQISETMILLTDLKIAGNRSFCYSDIKDAGEGAGTSRKGSIERLKDRGVKSVRQYEMFELAFQAEEPEGSWAQADMTARFVSESRTAEVKGFYAGQGQYKVRFYPEEPGAYEWEVFGTVEARGREICKPAKEGDSRAGAHGIVRAEGLHFRYADGIRYQPFGTTVYALVHQEKQLVDATMESLRQSAFNKVRFCVLPKHYDFNHNDPEYFPFEKKEGKWDVHKPCFAYWEALENRIRQLDDMGIQGDLILFHPYDRWGFAQFGREESLVYLDYLLRRLAAFPNLWWSMANEYDLMRNYTLRDWEEMTRFVAGADFCHHLLSNHNCFAYWDFSQPEITHCCIQDVNVDEVPELQRKYNKPVVFDECRYEGNIIHSWGNLSARELVHRFWTAVVYGGYCTHGETFYSDDEVLWWAKGGVLKGESPARIAFLRELVESFPGPLEAWAEGLGSITVEMVEELKQTGLPEEQKDNFFLRGLVCMPKEKILPFVLRHRPCIGHCGREIYLRYYGKECTSIGELFLPEDEKYRVEVIDTWEMTRQVAAEGVSGNIRMALPGKENMALLASRTESGA